MEFHNMVKKFSAQVGDIVSKTEKRLIALARQSTQELVDQAQTPVAKGGKMRVDTGFLRASGQMSLNGMPTGPVRPDTDQEQYSWQQTTVITTLAKLKLGGAAFFGWTANYAKYREAYDGFLETAVQNWPAIVDKVTNQIKSRVK